MTLVTIPSRSPTGRTHVTVHPPEDDRVTLYTHNWCDSTTWYQKAVRVVDEVATVKVPTTYTTYTLGNTNIIDTYHGKITDEDYLLDAADNSYRVSVTVNDTPVTEQDPHYGSGGDFTVDYAAGEVTFLSALSGSDVVKVTYHYATTSEFIVKPESGKILEVTRIEAQFSDDIVLTDSVLFQAYGNVEDFAPQYTPVPYPAGTPIPLGPPDTYKTMYDYLNDSNGVYPKVPAIGGGGWRGLSTEIVSFPWDYQAVRQIDAARGVYLSTRLAHDEPFGGTYATATFYCLVIPEDQ